MSLWLACSKSSLSWVCTTPADRVPYASIGREVIECDAHKKHAYEMAQKSMVLLKNNKNILPLNASKIKRIALIGPNMDNGSTLLLTIWYA